MHRTTPRRATRSRATSTRGGFDGVAPGIFLGLSADGSTAADQRSLTRRFGMALAALVLLLSVPMYWAATAQAADDGRDSAVLARAEGDHDVDPESDDDDDDTSGNTGAASDAESGDETGGINTDAGLAAQFTGASTVGETDPGDNTGATEQTQGTGGETGGNTDAGLQAQFTGASTVGETDLNDGTGATEQTEGTDVETKGQTDPRADTGVSTVGETDPRDDTGATEQR